ncbi:hypothetical protein FNF27_07279 [Cafeteria roenbergensis]|uniref:Uncharacterized protein n=1 Tax=Cafeteria roenbergensis TaxID=33653 RepID=A0A5A8DQH6_CAFRO|nr:hypothetical protein FNF27_07279 [Cafeteria roenbergensis]|mmetsp:Transcript_25439/g.95867  ORF Transcript_25439/g.95867 Transcript_25439/m.95867 type:complete len:1102 (-) Transcript_25439:243-3548(-)
MSSADSIDVGDEVLWCSRHRGVVCFAGEVALSSKVETCIGVEFDAPVAGGHDGKLDGVTYFRGRPGYCLIVPRSADRLVPFTAQRKAAAVIAAAARGAAVRMRLRAESLAAFIKTLEEYKETCMNKAMAEMAARQRSGAGFRSARREELKRTGTVARVFDEGRLSAGTIAEDAFKVPPAPSAVQSMLDGLRDGLVPHPAVALRLLRAAHALLRDLPNGHGMRVGPGERLTVVGDLHGHLDSLFFILQCNGAPSASNKYIFNGDLVDRGPCSIEVVLTVVGMLLLHGPGRVSIGRGNHEAADQNQMYCGRGGRYGHDVGFHLDCDSKYGHDDGAQVYAACMEVFNALPLFHTVHAPAADRKAFVVHGGLFMEPAVTTAMLQRIHRFRPIPVGGTSLDDRLFVQAMWSDPREMRGASMNDARGDIPCVFGESVTRDFCERNGFDMVVRSHEVEMEGHCRWHSGRLVTIFSASGYMNVRRGTGSVSNKGSIMVFNEELSGRVDTFTAPALDMTRPVVVDPKWLGVSPVADPAAADAAWAARVAALDACTDEDVEFSVAQAGRSSAGLGGFGRPRGHPAPQLGAAGRGGVRPPAPPRRPATAGTVMEAVSEGEPAAASAPEAAPSSAAAAAAMLRMPHPLEGDEAVAAARSAAEKASTRSEQDWKNAREIVVDAIVERKTDLYWCFSSADEANTGRVSIDEWCTGMQQCMPFDAPSWRQVNAEFCLVDVGDDGSVNYCRFLDRYVGDITPHRRSAQQHIMRSVAQRLFRAVSEPTVEAIFHELDTNGDGVVDFHEFVSGLERVGVGLNRNQLVLLMHAIDVSMDGTISMQELENTFKVSFDPKTDAGRTAAAAMSDDISDCIRRIGGLILKAGAGLKELFESMDADGNGDLSYDEFAAVLTRLRLKPPLTADQVAGVCKLVDADGSGSIDFSEFREAFSVEIAPPPSGPMDTAEVPPPAQQAAAAAAAGAAAGGRRASMPMLRVGKRNRIDFLSAIFSDIAIRFKSHAGHLGVAFNTYDTDGDGVLSRDEFHVALNSIGLDLEPEVLDAVIEAMDTDCDGCVDVREFIGALSTSDKERSADAPMPAGRGTAGGPAGASLFGGRSA